MRERSALTQEELEKGRVYVVLDHDEYGNLQIALPFDRRTGTIPARARYVIQDFEAMLARLGAQLAAARFLDTLCMGEEGSQPKLPPRPSSDRKDTSPELSKAEKVSGSGTAWWSNRSS
jgi:hypothetical protein